MKIKELEQLYDPLRGLKAKLSAKAATDAVYTAFQKELTEICQQLIDFLHEAKEATFDYESFDPVHVVSRIFIGIGILIPGNAFTSFGILANSDFANSYCIVKFRLG